MKQEDIEFLKELKKKIKEGNRCGEAEPAYWMIEDQDSYGSSDPEGADEAILCNPEDCYHQYTDDDLEDVKEALAKTAEGNYFEDELADCKTINEVIDLMERYNVYESEDNNLVKIVYLHYYWKLCDFSGAFLTYEDAEEHLKENYYHYSGKAHPYALTAFRNPTFERLWKIITETDWDKEKGS